MIGIGADLILEIEIAIEEEGHGTEARNHQQPPDRADGDGRHHQREGVNDAEERFAGEIARQHLRQQETKHDLAGDGEDGETYRQTDRMQKIVIKNQTADNCPSH